jgi:hypothetical protein
MRRPTVLSLIYFTDDYAENMFNMFMKCLETTPLDRFLL